MSILDYRVTRRQFLGGSALAVGGAGYTVGGNEGVGLITGAIDIHRTWDLASRPNREYLAVEGKAFSNLRLGATFAPEQWDDDQTTPDEPLRALDFAVKSLGMRNVRLGLRWDQVQQPDDTISLDYYRPFFDYCIANGLEVCLNVGPVRVFRWPEDHVPATVLDRLQRPPATGATIDAGDELARIGRDYLGRLFDVLRAEYSVADLGAVTELQPENEPFFPFGAHDWTMTRAYMKAVVAQIEEGLPGRRLLVTSAGRLSLKPIHGLFTDLLHDQTFRGRLVSGFDYHYKTPHLDEYPVIRHFDPIVFAFKFPPAKTCSENIDDSRRDGFVIQVSEGEAEPSDYLQSPGNSARDFRFMLARCADHVIDPKAPSLLRVWGVEYLAKRALRGEATDDHRQIYELIETINGTAGA